MSIYHKKLYFLIYTLTLYCFIISSCKKKEESESLVPPSETNFKVSKPEDIVMYEINFGAFSSTKNINAITERLDSIKELGINTIWLMPNYPTGILKSFGSPYCIKNYTEVNQKLGTIADLKNLVEKAHEKKIAVILDWVANHTSWDHAWINNESWYTKNSAGTIISPAGTNWNDVADLNFANQEMRLEMIAAMKYWIQNVGIDGYRCDAADFVPFDFWKQALDSLKKIKGNNLILLAEGDRSDHFKAGFQLSFSWNHLSSIKNVFKNNQSVNTLFTSNTIEQQSVSEGNRKLRFTTNHDESNISTPISVFGGLNAALAASIITIYLQGSPLIYCGQEVGVDNPAIYNGFSTINWKQNPELLKNYKKILNFYSSSNAAKKGTLVTFDNPDVAIFQKNSGIKYVLLLVNTRASIKKIAVPDLLKGNWVNVMNNDLTILSDSISLEPYQYFILKN